MEGLSYAEIAKVLEVPDGTAKGWVSRGRAAMLVALTRESISGGIWIGGYPVREEAEKNLGSPASIGSYATGEPEGEAARAAFGRPESEGQGDAWRYSCRCSTTRLRPL